jgi:uncharacterized protein with PQ loop repeat
MPTDVITALGAVAAIYSVAAGTTLLLQARQMLRRGSSRDVSMAFLASTSAGYLIWLLYGIGIASLPLIAADAVGLVCSAVAVVVAVRLRRGGASAAGKGSPDRPPRTACEGPRSRRPIERRGACRRRQPAISCTA